MWRVCLVFAVGCAHRQPMTGEWCGTTRAALNAMDDAYGKCLAGVADQCVPAGLALAGDNLAGFADKDAAHNAFEHACAAGIERGCELAQPQNDATTPR
jgi:hypothetical protein